MSLLELLTYLEDELGKKIPLNWSDWRPGDQSVFVCNLEKAREHMGWRPDISVKEGVGQLISWVRENEPLFDWLK